MKLAMIGVGHMGGAILKAILSQQTVVPEKILFSVATETHRDRLQAEFGIRPCAVSDMPALADVIIIGVRPADAAPVLEKLAQSPERSRPLYLSIMGGRRLEWLEERLPNARVIRIMPNLGVSVRQGMCAYACGTRATEDDAARTQQLLETFGTALKLPEENMDAVTALSGSGPAFFAYALQAMTKGGIALGIEPAAAATLARQTLLGTATVLSRPGAPDTEAFIRSVATKGGTTAAGMQVLEASAVNDAFAATLNAAAKRSAELSAL